eukprot:TRINITY_DN13499_c0_g1_i1.p1 TRINITY_DN13499_c0_g1~~TRINITY_DN13499_c0_g1_i1.p1  ORF type:complete len:1204 (+),score=301.64 TRINITY_DN13499_c0_g1_i1:298-3909(+)
MDKETAGSVSLFRVLRVSFGADFLRMVPFKLVNDSVQYVNPVLIHALVHIIEHGDKDNLTLAYVLAGCMFLASETQSIASGQYFMAGFRLGLRTRCALNQAVYAKSLRLSNSARKDHPEGAVLSYMQIDSQKLCDSIPYLNMVWSAPLQFSLCMLLLYRELQWSCFAGVAVLVALIPLNTKVATTQRKFTRATMKSRDQRVNLLSEMLQAIRSIKMFAWESPAMKSIEAKREVEATVIRGNSLWGAFSTFLWGGSPLLVTVSTFAVYTLLMDGTLTATKAFTSMALFNLLRFPLSMIPGSISRIIDISVVIGRLGAFLNAEEKATQVLSEGHDGFSGLSSGHYSSPEQAESAVTVTDATFAWTAVPKSKDSDEEDTQAPFELRGVSLSAPTGSLVGITGAVGSGKSSLLAGLANLMDIKAGVVVLRGKVAFCAQQPWIQNCSLRDNILFGREFDEQRFQKVLEACALIDDIRSLADHELTQIGERGVTLSGGQKARVALARACYVDADVYLLDDILSAVDSGVGEHIMEKCVQGLLRHKTVLLATHHIQWLAVCDHVAHVDKASVVAQGSWAEMEQHIGESLGFSNIKRTAIQHSETLKGDEGPSEPPREEGEKAVAVTGQKKEDSEEGLVKQHIWVGYGKALTKKLLILMLLVYTIAAGLQVASSFWLSHWSNQSDNPDAKGSTFYLGIYAALAIGAMLLIWVRAITIALATIAAGKRVHAASLESVFHTPTTYFDETPLGRIINRFSSDLQVIDVQMRMTLQGMLLSLFNLMSTLGVALSATPFLGLLLVPLAWIYYTVSKYYRHSSREVQRLTSTSLSPIYTAFAETISGTDTIVTFQDQSRFLGENAARMDFNLKAAFVGVAANRWLAIRLELIGNVLVLATASLVVFEYRQGNINAGMAGLALSYVVTFTDYLNWLIRQFTSAEAQMVAVERLDKLCNLEREPDPEDTGDFQQWPASAEIEFCHLSMKYRPELPLVLSGVSAVIQQGERVGICGRTGSGKSTLLTMLFLMNRPLSGSVLIGGTDITTVPLRVLRSAIACIPQEPVIFSGSLRYNLDPFASDNSQEQAMWHVLEQASLAEYVRGQDRGMDMVLEAGGANLSVGQRQLVCLARALLRGAKILVLDEATASIDLKTDAVIQEALLHNLHGKTVLTVAHRIDTIMNYDRILYLEQGKVVETGNPQELKKDSGSRFAQLCVGH